MQRLFTDPTRPDNRTTDGQPTDCFRAAVATLLDLPYDWVPHFALYGPSWWDVARRWARGYGGDLAQVAAHNGSIRYAFAGEPPARLIAVGPRRQRRLPIGHAVVADTDLRLIHDPHPSGAGLATVEAVIVWHAPYDHPPIEPLRELTAQEGPAP